MSTTPAGREVTEHTTSSARHTTGYLACGGEDRTWSLEQSNESWMTIYAPYRRLELAGEGALHGSLIVGELDWRSDGQMHYDPQIVEDAPFARVPGTWIELRR